ncbi:MAG: hypothetical protein ACR2LA_00040, partial [Acidimicrobiales bacterium]
MIALDRNDREVWAMLRVASDDQGSIRVPAGVIAQAWRDGARQVLLARALRHCDEVVLDGAGARAAGLLCGQASTADVIDASVVLTAAGSARHGDTAVLTSDPGDIAHLLSVMATDAGVI